MDLKKDYYQVLGIDKNADDNTIKKVFRKLSKTHHPDAGGNPDKFREINEAHGVLSSEKRQQYDTQSPNGSNYKPDPFSGMFGGGGGGINMNDIFSSMNRNYGDVFRDFGGGNAHAHQQQYWQQQEPAEKLDLRITIPISLEEIYNNETKKIKYKRMVPCSKCDSTGVEEGNETVDCENCQGSGKVNINGRQSFCELCRGKGKIHSDTCSRCNGAKLSKKEEVISVDNIFMAGLRTTTFPLKGMGNYSQYYRGRRGDLQVALKATPHPEYNINGFNLERTIKVDFKTAILGGMVKFKHLHGEDIKFKIPAKTNTGKGFKLSGYGLMPNQAGIRGDLFITIEVFIDYDKLSDTDIALMQNIGA